ncbi:hypothetical protein FHS85_004961 [Rhodoligotrophos appendicifer]
MTPEVTTVLLEAKKLSIVYRSLDDKDFSSRSV